MSSDVEVVEEPKVVPIRPGLRAKGDRTPVPEVVEELERLMSEARAGDIISLAYVSQNPEFAIVPRIVGLGDRIRTIAGCAILHHRLLVEDYRLDFPDDEPDEPITS